MADSARSECVAGALSMSTRCAREIHMHVTTGGDSLLIAFLIWIVVGAVIGWLAGLLIQGG